MAVSIVLRRLCPVAVLSLVLVGSACDTGPRWTEEGRFGRLRDLGEGEVEVCVLLDIGPGCRSGFIAVPEGLTAG